MGLGTKKCTYVSDYLKGSKNVNTGWGENFSFILLKKLGES